MKKLLIVFLTLGALGMRYAHYPFGGGGGNEVKSVSTLSKYQKPIAKQFQSYLEPRIGQPGPTYTGQMVAPMSAQEQQAMALLNQYLSGAPALYGEAGQALASALSGRPTTDVNPAATTAFYKTAIEAPAMEAFRGTVLPGVREAYVGPGTYWGSARAGGEQEAWRGLEKDLLGQWGTLQYADEQARRGLLESAAARQQAAIPQAQAYGNILPGQAALGLSLGALPRTLEQAQLQADFEQWMQARPEYSPVLNQALQFLGIPMIGMYQPAPKPDYLSGALSTAALLAGMYFMGPAAGAGTGAGVGGTQGFGFGLPWGGG